MKSHIRYVFTHPLISGSAVIFVGTMTANVLNFIFNLYMNRNLKIEEYGIVVSLSSLIVLLSIPINSIAPTLIAFAATHFVKRELSQVKSLFLKTIKTVGAVGLILLALFLFFPHQIGSFFLIDNPEFIMIAGITIFIAYLGIVNASLLQAKLAFNFISFSNFIAAFAKLVILILVIHLGFGVLGALFATLIAYLLPFAIAFFPLRDILKIKAKSSEELQLGDIISYGLPSSIATFSLTALISTDVLLVKHFFSPHEAGLYAGLSLIGRVIFFFTSPIGIVMFPLIVQKAAKKESYKSILITAVIIVFSCSLAISTFYFMFPDFAIKFFLKNMEYSVIKNYLGFYALFISVYSLVSLFVYYFLSIKKTNIYIPVGFSAVVQLIAIIFFHSNFYNVIFLSLTITSILLAFLVLYYLRLKNQKNYVLEV